MKLVVPKSKTAAGTGRLIPFTRRVCACLSLWLSRFPDAGPETFVFPIHQVGIGGNSRTVEIYDVDLETSNGFLAQGVARCVQEGWSALPLA